MSDLTSRLRERLEFDEQDFIEKYVIEHGPRGGMQLEYLIKGARYQHALTVPIFEELLKCVEALEWIMPKVHQAYHEGELSECQKSSCQEYRKALAALEGKLDTKGESGK